MQNSQTVPLYGLSVRALIPVQGLQICHTINVKINEFREYKDKTSLTYITADLDFCVISATFIIIQFTFAETTMAFFLKLLPALQKHFLSN